MIKIEFNDYYKIAILKRLNCVQIELLVLDKNTWNRLTMCK